MLDSTRVELTLMSSVYEKSCSSPVYSFIANEQSDAEHSVIQLRAQELKNYFYYINLI